MYSSIRSNRTRIAEILATVSAQSQQSLRDLVDCLPPPIDAPFTERIISTSLACLKEFRASLTTPSPRLDVIIDALVILGEEVLALPAMFTRPLDRTMAWRLEPFQQWALFLAVHNEGAVPNIKIVVGAELARSLMLGKRCDKAFAKGLRQHLESTVDPDGSGMPEALSRKCASILVDARVLFGDGTAGLVESEAFDTTLRRYFDNRIKYGTNKAHQAVLNHRCQSVRQVVRSARELRSGVETGDESFVMVACAICAGLPLSLIARLPLLSRIKGDWLMALDLESGQVKMCLSLIVPDAAKPSDGAEGLVEALQLVVRPLPAFLYKALLALAARWPVAGTLGEMLPNSQATSQLVIFDPEVRRALPPSVARLLNAMGPFAVRAGNSRMLATLVTNDVRLIPKAKLHYAAVSRTEIWDASAQFFDALGWGDPVPMEAGLAVGSMVTPSLETVSRWLHWMLLEVVALRPGPRAAFARLVDHHNAFARSVASIAVFLLALRNRNPIALNAHYTVGNGAVMIVADKRVGPFPFPGSVPVCPFLLRQLELWRLHCLALDARMAKLGLPEDCVVRMHLRDVIEGKPVEHFFEIESAKRVVLLCSDRLGKWWPAWFGLVVNFGRHFWQTNFPRLGLTSREVDTFVRHHLRGSFAWTGDSDVVLADWVDRCIDAQERLLRELGAQPINGLCKKGDSK